MLGNPLTKRSGKSNLKARAGVGLFICTAFTIQCHHASTRVEAPREPVSVELVSTAAVLTDVVDRNEALARRDPLGFLQKCWERQQREVRGYHCRFWKQEYLNGEVTPEQTAEVRVLQQPFSVDMTFTHNIGDCKRALYVEGAWKDDEGNELAWAKPAGAIIKAFIPKIQQPIHGSRAQKASRRTIDQFGFDKSFELIMKYSLKAKARGELSLKYVGRGAVEGRPTYVFERRLPYTGEELPYPDNLLIVHIDQEYLVPTACHSYADSEGQELLGSYVYTDISLNPGYTPDDFDPEKINF